VVVIETNGGEIMTTQKDDVAAKTVKLARDQFLRQLKQEKVFQGEAMWLLGMEDVIPTDFVRENICEAIDKVVTPDNVITSKLVEPVLAEVTKIVRVADLDKLRVFIQQELEKKRS
jgi:hypothetical protein